MPPRPPKRVFLGTVDLVATLYLSDVTIMLPPHTRWPLSLSPPQGALIAKLHHQKWAGQYLKSFWLSLTNRQILRWPSEKESLISLSSVKTGCNSRFWWISPPMFAETCLQQPGTYFVLQPLSEAHQISTDGEMSRLVKARHPFPSSDATYRTTALQHDQCNPE